MNGDVGQAADHNLVALLAFPYLMAVGVMAVYRRLTSTARWMPPPSLPWLFAAAIIAWWLARNLPYFDWLASEAGA